MPKMSSINAYYHSAQYLIYALQNPLPAIPLVKLGHGHKEALNILSDIFIKAKTSAVPLMVPIREVDQIKLR